MKKFACLVIFLIVYGNVGAQQKLCDGVYLVDRLSPISRLPGRIHTSLIKFNPLFLEDDPEAFSPISVFTDEFVPFEFSMAPITKTNRYQNKVLFLKLTESASEKLKIFTAKNIKRYAVIIVNGEAITVHKIKEPIISGLVQIACDTENIYEQLHALLQNNVKSKI